ncbi:MAG: serine/threonine protein kinase [Polyangiaceae bacterium]|nr:serine/threonine protein kinase [Polyangiaceae bacterium]
MRLHGSNAEDRGLASNSAMGCLDDAAVDDLVHGRLAGERLRQVEAHLDGCTTCSTLVAALAGGAPAGAPAPGAMVGRHRVLDKLGRGAMGVVYLAHDPALDRRVALKLIRPGASASSADRMAREAQAMARLSHPNVAAVYEVGHVEPEIYLSMEYVEGETLRAWLLSKKRAYEEIRSVFAQAGEGLAAAHRAGIVHRDFKPENVMVGVDGRVRVTDFGLACVASVDIGHTDVDSRRRLVGTPAYMSPEQLDERDATTHSDQFAFAVCLYEALSGKRPFAGSTPEELRRSMTDRARVEDLFGVPRRVQRALQRALSPATNARFSSMDDLLRELQQTPQQRYAPWFAAMGLVAAGAAITILATRQPAAGHAPDPCAAGPLRMAPVWSNERAARVTRAFEATNSPIAKESAERTISAVQTFTGQWQEAHRETCEATHVRHEQSEATLDARMHCLDRRLQSLDALGTTLENANADMVLGATSAVLDLPSIAECSGVESLLGEDPRPTDADRRGRLETLEHELDELRATAASGGYTAALPTAKRLVADAVAIGYQPAIAEAKVLAARIARRAGSFDDASAFATDAQLVALAARADGTAAQAWLEIMAVAGSRGRFADVESNAAQVAAAIARIGDPPSLRAAYLLQVGLAHTASGELDTASIELNEALATYERIGDDKSLRGSRVLTALGDLARIRGDLADALELHTRARAIDEQVLGPNHPAIARHHHNAAGVLRLLERRSEALERYGRARELELLLGERHPSVGLTENSIGIVLIELGRTAEARAHLDIAASILTEAAHPDRALAFVNLGSVDAAEGKHTDAIVHLDQGISLLEKTLGPDHFRIAGAKWIRGRSHRALGDRTRADRDLSDAVRIAAMASDDSVEAADLRDQIEAELARTRVAAPRAAPARTNHPAREKPAPLVVPQPPPPKKLGSGTYGASTSWDSD